MARAARAGAVVAPRPLRRPQPRVAPPRTVPRAVRARGESLLDALLQGRAWIALVALLLVGIVFFNVDLLRLNRSIAATDQQAGAVERENSRLRLELGRLGSSERIQKVAEQRGLVLPAPGDVRFRRAGDRDGRLAAGNVRPAGESQAASHATAPAGVAPPGASGQPTTPQVPSTPATPQTTTPQVSTPQAQTPTSAAGSG